VVQNCQPWHFCRKTASSCKVVAFKTHEGFSISPVSSISIGVERRYPISLMLCQSAAPILFRLTFDCWGVSPFTPVTRSRRRRRDLEPKLCPVAGKSVPCRAKLGDVEKL
jgi:hypothetical protein